jgi:ABC-type bacteriocin/lantibiotic exporter with double-glycine peptidase domain
MSIGLKFSPEEEKEFQELITFHPITFSEKMGVQADKVANTIWMFFFLLLFSIISYVFFQNILDKCLFISNTYQLVALPVLGLATGLSMIINLRFLFRILLEVRAQFTDIKKMISLILQNIDLEKEELVELKEIKNKLEEGSE